MTYEQEELNSIYFQPHSNFNSSILWRLFVYNIDPIQLKIYNEQLSYLGSVFALLDCQ